MIVLVPNLGRAGMPYHAVHGLDAAKYQAWIQTQEQEKYRPMWVQTVAQGQTLYSAIAIRDGIDVAWKAKHGLSAAEYQQEFDSAAQDGMRSVCVSACLENSEERFTGLWVKDGVVGNWTQRTGLSSAEYQSLFQEQTKQGLLPTLLNSHLSGQSPRYGAIFRERHWPDFEAKHGLSTTAYQEFITQSRKKGLRPLFVTACEGTSGPLFASVVVREALEWRAKHGLTPAAFQQEIDKNDHDGFRPVSICGYVDHSQLRYAAIWIHNADAFPSNGQLVPELAGYDQAMQKFLREREIPAGVLAVSKQGKLLMSRGYGYADAGQTRPTQPDEPFRIASITKPLTAACIRKLVRENRLKYDAQAFPLLGVTPPPQQAQDPRLNQITIQHLLDHKGGWDSKTAQDPMFRSREIAKALGKTSPALANDVVHYMVGQPLQHDPGSQPSHYSNFGYCVLGRVIEKITQKTFIEYLEQDLLGPADITGITLGRTLPKDRNPPEPFYAATGMGHSVFGPASGELVPEGDGGFCLEAMDSHGGLIATAPALSRFLHHYWISGEPRLPKQTQNWTFFGSLPGTFTMAHQRDGVDVVVFFNKRREGSDQEMKTLQKLFDDAIAETRGR